MNTLRTVSKISLFLLSGCFFSANQVFGDAVGGYLSYELKSNDSADITLHIFRSCFSIPLNPSPQVTLTQGSITQNITLSKVSSNEVISYCSPSYSACNGGTNAGFEDWKFVKRISLSAFSSGQEVKMYWQECCSGGSINTISSANMYIEGYFMKGLSVNEGIDFCFPLPLILQSGIANSFCARIKNDHGDSIVYSMAPALVASGSSATYNSPYTYSKPFPYNGSMVFSLQFDSKTGVLKAGNSESFTPTGATANYWIAYTISRFRGGVRIGQVMVSHQLSVLANLSSNLPPAITSASSAYKVCAGTPLCFDLFTSDLNTNDSTAIYCDGIITGSSFQSSGTKNARGTFCWTPASSQARNEPYYVVFRCVDNSCPKKADSYKTVAVYVSVSGGNISTNSVAAYNYCSGKVHFQANASGSSLQYQWAGTGGLSSTDSIFSFTYPTLGKHYYSLRISSAQSCGDYIKNDSVVVPQHVPLSASIDGKVDTVTCANAPLLLTATYNGGKAPYGFSWNGSSLTANRNYTYQSTQPGTVTLLMTDSFGCSKTAQINIGIRNLPSVFVLTPDTSVCYNSGALSLSGSPAGGTWSGSGSTCLSGSIFTPKLACAGANQIIYNYTDGYGCTNSDTLKLIVLNSILSQTGSYFPVCNNALPVQLNGTPANGSWSGYGIVGDKFYPSIAGVGNHTITYQAAGGCGSIASTFINVLYSAQISFTNPSNVFCETSNQAFLFANPSGGIWSGNSVQSNGTFNPSAAGTGNHYVTYVYTYTNGCVTTDSTLIKVEQLPVVNAGSDKKTCINNGDITLSGYPAGGVWSGTSVTGNKFNTGIAAGAYKIMYSYTAQACNNKDSIQVNVMAADFSSLTVLGNAPFTVNFSNSSSVGFSGFEWNFGDTLSGANNTSVAFAPSHTYQQQGSYTVKLTAFNQEGNCTTSQTKSSYINVNPNGVSAVTGNSELLIYPNPANAGFIIVNWLSSANENYLIHIYDLSGREVQQLEAGTNTEQLISGLSKGIYLLKVKSNSGLTATKKFVVQ